MKNKIPAIFAFLGFVIFLVGTLISVLDEETGMYVAASIISYTTIATALACCFVFAKNKTVVNVGYGLCALVGVYGVGSLIGAEEFSVTAFGLVFMLIAAILYAIVIALNFFGYSKGGIFKNNDSVLCQLGQYKALEKEKVINAEEFDTIKTNLLNNATNVSYNISDLKKWKKLLDENIINDEEFAKIKEKVIK